MVRAAGGTAQPAGFIAAGGISRKEIGHRLSSGISRYLLWCRLHVLIVKHLQIVWNAGFGALAEARKACLEYWPFL